MGGGRRGGGRRGGGRRLKVFPFATHEESKALARALVSSFPKGALVALYGDLGAGKTLLAKDIGKEALDLEGMASPTYTYMHLYEGLVHFDLWRLEDETDFLNLGFEDYLHQGGWVIVEWAGKIEKLLPKGTVRIVLKNGLATVDHDLF